MSTLLQTMDGDLDLGTRKLVIISDPANLVALRLTNMFRLWQGEWFLDTSTGFPWFSVLGQKFSKLEAVRQLIARRVLAVPGVKAIEKMTLEPTANRSLRVVLRVKTASELVVGSSDTGFVIQSAVGNNPVPVFTSTIPDFAYVGSGDTALSVIGAKIVATTRFLFDGSEIPFLISSSTGGSVVISSANLLSAGEHTMQLFTPPLGGGSSSTRTFYVKFPIPVLSAVVPTTGDVGVLVNAYVNGTGLSSSSIVYVNGLPVATTYNPGPGVGYPRLEFSFTPVTVGDQTIHVENPTTAGGGGPSNDVVYESEGPFTTSVVPTTATQFDDGPVGALLNGGGFTAATDVNASGVGDYSPTSFTPTQMVFTADNAFYKNSGSLNVAAKDSSSGYVSNAQIITVTPWSILDLSGLTAWWKVDSGVTNDGSGRCSLWADQSGNGRDLDQVTSGKRPLINQNPLNGIGGLYFDAARLDRLFSALAWSTFVTTSTSNIWIVARTDTANGRVLSDTNGYRSICIGQISPLRLRSIQGNVSVNLDTPTFDWQSGPDPFFYRFRHTGGNIYARVNRTTEQTAVCGNTISTETLAMGGSNGVAGNYTGTIYEVIICNANQTTANFGRVDNYLANKYGLPLV